MWKTPGAILSWTFEETFGGKATVDPEKGFRTFYWLYGRYELIWFALINYKNVSQNKLRSKLYCLEYHRQRFKSKLIFISFGYI